MKTWKHYLAITAAATALMGGAAFAQQAPQNAPWQYGQNQQQVQPVQPVQQGQDNHNRQQPGVNQPSDKQQPKDTKKDTKNQKNLKKETVPKKQTTTRTRPKIYRKSKIQKTQQFPISRIKTGHTATMHRVTTADIVYGTPVL